VQETARGNSEMKSSLKYLEPPTSAAETRIHTLRGGCRVLPYLMLVTKLKGLLGVAVVAGMSILAPTPSLAASCNGASYYGVGDGYHGQTTASGERFNTYAMTAAHRYLPFGTRLRVTHEGRSVVVRINDRGPFVAGRDLDLSYAAFSALASPGRGHINVCYSRV
jgi:rare lipoprotein A